MKQPRRPARSHTNLPGSSQAAFSLGSEGEAVDGEFCVDHITFSNPDTGYAVVRLVYADADTDSPATYTDTGIFGTVQEGSCYRVQGIWHHDRRYGPQIRASSAILQTPTTPQAIRRYLAGASIKGLGPHHAGLVVDHFGARVLEVLDQGGRELQQVRGIGPVRAAKIRESWAEHRAINRLMVSLQGVAGLTPRQAQRIFREFGDAAWQTVSSDPYLLAERVSGFGFLTCDRIARTLGLPSDSPQRLQAGILHALNQALDEGHLWTSPDELVTQAASLLEAEPGLVAAQLEQLVAGQRVIRRTIVSADGNTGIYLRAVAEAEERIASRLRTWLEQPAATPLNLQPGDALELARQCSQTDLTQDQYAAVVSLLTGTRLVVLTGGPGTGKTTAMRALIRSLEALQVTYALCATTGRAAKQLSYATDRQAATVHRYLGLGAQAQRLPPEPVRESVFVIDEASMIDLWLMDQIMARLGARTHLFLVGDVDQLPPVGPGAILHDLIEASPRTAGGRVTVTRLDLIFRQEAGDVSLIAANCRRIREGLRPLPPANSAADYFEMPRETPAEALELAVELAAQRLPEYLGIPSSEVQILTPVHSGEAGVQALNAALQARLNPPSPVKSECALGRQDQGTPSVMRVGDRVRQTRNDYQKKVFNGDLGTVVSIDQDEHRVRVAFDDDTVDYAFAELDDLVHSWAMTVHAGQGSQWPAVIVIMLSAHYVMLERNILYTALSRAQRLAVLISQERALRIAIQRTTLVSRRTDLVGRLVGSETG